MKLIWNHNPILEALIASIHGNPDKWKTDDYRFAIGKDDAQISIWIANEDYGIKIEQPKGYKLAGREKKRLWKTYQQWRSRNCTVQRFLEILKAAEAA